MKGAFFGCGSLVPAKSFIMQIVKKNACSNWKHLLKLYFLIIVDFNDIHCCGLLFTSQILMVFCKL